VDYERGISKSIFGCCGLFWPLDRRDLEVDRSDLEAPRSSEAPFFASTATFAVSISSPLLSSEGAFFRADNCQLYEVDAVIVGRSACRTVRNHSLAIQQVNWSTNDAAMYKAAIVLKR
jgi:hypothetical protein